MTARFCRDCSNFEDRRDIDSIAVCAKNSGPYISCEEFEPRNHITTENSLRYRFCSECTNFEDVNGTSVCAKNHTPGVACESFIDRFEKLYVIRQNNHMKVALLAHAINRRSSQDPFPESLVEIGRKIRW